jgi:hypothetical protein
MAFRPIHGFATEISKPATWQSLKTLTTPKGRGFPRQTKTPPGAKRELPNTPLSDVVNAEELVERHGKDMRYCHPWSKWLVWIGTHWRIDDTGWALAPLYQAPKAPVLHCVTFVSVPVLLPKSPLHIPGRCDRWKTYRCLPYSKSTCGSRLLGPDIPG